MARDLERERGKKLKALKVFTVPSSSSSTISEALARGITRTQALEDLYAPLRTPVVIAKEVAIAAATSLEELDAIDVRPGP